MQARKFAPGLVFFGLLEACSGGSSTSPTPNSQPPPPAAFSTQTVSFSSEFSNPIDVEAADFEGQLIFQGDIVVSESSVAPQDDAPNNGLLFSTTTSASFRWPRAVIPFEIQSTPGGFSSDYTEQINQAMRHWQHETVMRFVPRTHQAHYVVFTPSNSCNSRIGRRGGRQTINLSPDSFTCQYGGIVHVIGHAVGLIHEQSRCDRNGFISIAEKNIDPTVLEGAGSIQANFGRQIGQSIGLGDYDYRSIMHFGMFAAAKPRLPAPECLGNVMTCLPVVVPRDSLFDDDIGQRQRLSDGDKASVSAMYPIEFFSARAAQNSFTLDSGWDARTFPIEVGDVNADGRDDIIGFGEQNVFVSYADDDGFLPPEAVLNSFALDTWPFATFPLRIGNVDGQFGDDIVGFGQSDVLVSFSNAAGRFDPPVPVLKSFVLDSWPFDTLPVTLGDVNADGRDDIIGFGQSDVLVAFSSGAGFDSPVSVSQSFVLDSWPFASQPVKVGDVNGDGMIDIVGFGRSKLFVSYSNGLSFDAPRILASPYVSGNGFGGEEVNGFLNNIVKLGDFNGDSRADIVAFIDSGVELQLSTGTNFAEPQQILDGTYTLATGWDPSIFPRRIGDVNGDGQMDFVGFERTEVFVSTQEVSRRVNIPPGTVIDPLCTN